MSDIGFVICIKGGRLESEALLLAESLRAWGGGLAEAPLYAISPRPGEEPDDDAVGRLRELGATYLAEPIGADFEGVLPADKVAVAAFAERALDHQTLAFVDSDTVFLNEPSELVEGDWLAAARPVDRRIAGSRGKGKNEPYWQRMYEALGVRGRPFVETTVGQMPIRAYWNTGLLAVRRETGLFAAWENALATLFEREVVHRRMPFFMDQLAWAAVIADLHDRVRVLSHAYNYPLRHRGALVAEARELDLDEIVHLHYRLLFHVPGALEAANPPFTVGSDRYAWLAERLPVEPIEAITEDQE